MSWRVVAVAVVGLVALAACADDDAAPSPATAAGAPAATAVGASATSVPSVSGAAATTAPPASVPPGVAPDGFDTVAGRVTAADGETCDVCVWLARTPEQQQRGLMGVTDLSGADGMLFRFGGATTVDFWIRDTPLPLSIAFFAEDGTFVSSTEMAPCMTGPDAGCTLYAAAGPYADALEVAAGTLPDLLIGPGARLDVSDQPCPRSP